MNRCPNCAIIWQSEKNVYEYFLSEGKSQDTAMEFSKYFGHTEDSPVYFGVNVKAIEYRDKYDGIWEWECLSCGHIEPRN